MRFLAKMRGRLIALGLTGVLLLSVVLVAVMSPDSREARGATEPVSSASPAVEAAADDRIGMTDPLAGERNLLRDDEFVILYNNYRENAECETVINQLVYPSSGRIRTLLPIQTRSAGEYCTLPDSYIATATGPMHTLRNDEVFDVFVDSKSEGEGKLIITIVSLDPATGDSYTGSYADSGAEPSNVRLDCDTGDFDGDGRVEVAIVYEGAESHLSVLIVKGSDQGFEWPSHYEDRDVDLAGDKQLAVTAGDFDSDGTDEIAVIYKWSVSSTTQCLNEDPNEDISMRVYDVFPDFGIKAKGAGDLISKSCPLVCPGLPIGPPQIDIAAGDFDGQPGEEVLVASHQYEQGFYYVNYVVYDVDSELTFSPVGYLRFVTSICSLRIAIGDLDHDLADEAVVYRRQANWSRPQDTEEFLDVLEFDANMKIKLQFKWTIMALGSGFMDVAVGHFTGTDYPEVLLVAGGSTLEGRIIGFTRDWYIDYDRYLGLDEIFPDYDRQLGGGKRIVVAVGDFDGDSVILGEPTHWEVQGDLEPILILGEPPKHIDYMADVKGQLGELNISRTCEFKAVFEDHDQSEISRTNEHSTDFTFSIEAGAEVDYAPPAGLQAEFEVAGGYTRHVLENNLDRYYSSIERSEVLTALNDDYLVYNETRLHFWLYPVKYAYDVESEDGEKGPLWMQIVVPEPDEDNPQHIDGAVVDWYQPLHENGNIFSYPWTKEQIWNFEGVQEGHLLTDVKSFWVGINETTFDVQWVEATETEVEKLTENRLDVDVRFQIGYKGVSWRGKGWVKTHFDKTWADLTTSTTRLSKSKGIRIVKGVIDGGESYGYDAHPLMYTKGVDTVKEDGAETKMPTGAISLAYLVKIPGTRDSYEWWHNFSGYGDAPDLALNLPHRWILADPTTVPCKGKTWEFGLDPINLNRMKGLLLLDKDGKPFGYCIREGETVTVKARIYNYSFKEANNVKVRIEAQESEDHENWGRRVQVGEDTISIQGWGPNPLKNPNNDPNWKYATVTFDTSGKANKYYKFWVTVDPDNAIEEVEGHGLGEDYGNNEGYFGIALAVTAEGESMVGGNLYHVGQSDALSFSDERPHEGDTVIISSRIGAEGGNAGHVVVSYYDGDPDEGGERFDIELIPFIRDGSSCYLEVPYHTHGKVGEHEIHVVIHEHLGETDVSENIAAGTIEVLPVSKGLAWYLILAIVLGSVVVLGGGFFALRRVRQVG